MEKQKESFLIIFEDNTKFNMIIHIKIERVDKSIILYLEPCVRIKSKNTYFQRQITDCVCGNCKNRLDLLVKNSKEIGVFNGIGNNVFEEDSVSFVCIRLDTLIGVKEQLEKITGEKIKHIILIEKERLFDLDALVLYYANPNFEGLLKNFLPLSFFKLVIL